jgi:hypothetical protein
LPDAPHRGENAHQLQEVAQMPKGCSKCGTQNADDAKFCRACGNTLAPPPPPRPPVFDEDATVIGAPCFACGHLNRAGSRFCAKCGAGLAASRAEPSSVPVQVPVPPTAPQSFEHYDPPPLGPSPRAFTPSQQIAPSGPAPFDPGMFDQPGANAGTFDASRSSPLPTSPPPSAFDFERTAAAPSTRKPMGLWIGLGVLIVALAAGGAWWFGHSRGEQIIDEVAEPAKPSKPAAPIEQPAPAPTAQGTPVPAATAPPDPAPVAVAPAAVPVPPAVETTPAPAVTPPAPVARPSTSATPATSDLWEPADKNAPPPTTSAQDQADKARAARDAREARAKALRDQRDLPSSQEPPRGRPVPSSTQGNQSVPPPPSRAGTPVPAQTPAQAAAPADDQQAPRTVSQRCATGNPIVQSLCEARECLHRSLANDAACKRISAASEKRMQRD